MATDFSAAEVLDLAKRIERSGEAFYRHAASLAKGSYLGDVFGKLAEMEGEHEQVFAALRDNFAQQNDLPANQKHWPAIAQSLLSRLDGELEARFRGKRSLRDIITEAIDFEKDTIVFLMVMKDMVTRPADRARVDLVIREEIGHIIQLGSHMAAQA
jgi:rubrerythrin